MSRQGRLLLVGKEKLNLRQMYDNYSGILFEPSRRRLHRIRHKFLGYGQQVASIVPLNSLSGFIGKSTGQISTTGQQENAKTFETRHWASQPVRLVFRFIVKCLHIFALHRRRPLPFIST